MVCSHFYVMMIFVIVKNTFNEFWRRTILNKKVIFTVVGIVAAIVFAVIIGAAVSKNEKSVASVEGENISKDELYDVLVAQYGQNALSYLIDNKIVDIEADKKNIKVSDKDVNAEMDKYITQSGGKEAFNSALAQSGVKKSDIEKEIVNYLKIKKLLGSKVKVTDEEISKYFEENKESFNQAEQVKASHILVEDEAKAKEIKAKLDAGEDFAKLAKENSTDEGTAAKGGDLGYFPKGKMMPEFEAAAFSMKVGEISDPVKTDYGYHIIKVTDKKEAKEAVLADHKEEIKDTLLNQKIQAEYSSWITGKRTKMDIKNSLTNK